MSKSTQKLVLIGSLVVFTFILGVNSVFASACGGAVNMYSYNGQVYLKTCNQRAWGSPIAVCTNSACVQTLCADEQESYTAQNNITVTKSMINGNLVDTLTWSCGGTICNVRYRTDYTPCYPGSGTVVSGSCGSANNGTYSSAPTANLCAAGNPSAVTGSGPWYWSCSGTNGGSSASCSAQKTPITCTWGCGAWGECINGTQSRSCYPAPSGCVGSNPFPTTQSCTSTCTSFSYTDWGACQSNNMQYRTVTASYPSGCVGGNPITSQSCSYTQTCTSFSYTDWGACQSNNMQYRTVTASYPSGCVGGNPITSQSCSYTPTCSWSCDAWGTCNNGIQYRNCTPSPSGCTGSNPYPTSQSCTVIVNGQCGYSNGGTFDNQPTGGLCNTGTASYISGSGPWNWTCYGSGGGSNAYCSAQKSTPTCTWSCDAWGTCNNGIQYRNCTPSPSGCTGSNPYPTSQSCTVVVNAQCGYSNGQSFASQPINGLCGAGNASSVTGSGPWYWACYGTGGGSSASCSAQKTATPINGQCGYSNGGSFGSQPTGGLCNLGNASSVTGSGPWYWACYGIDGGTTANCSAQKTATPINGQCGSSNGGSYTNQPTSGLCSQGNESSVTGSGPWYWTCYGSNGGSNASCSAQITATPVYGQCGSSNGQYFTSQPTNGLCSTGTASSVSGSGPWYWSCYGSNGGSNSNCSAFITSTSTNGQCGSANGQSYTSQPTSGLCSTGTASSITGNGPWYWACYGTNGGSNANCSAQLTQTIVNGQCGSSNGGTFDNQPTANLCNTGTASSITGNGPWYWACYGANGGSNANCSAQKSTTNCTWSCDAWGTCNNGIQYRNCTPSPSGCTGSNPYPTSQSCTSPVNGVCGSASGGSFATQPVSGLCNLGNSSSVTGSGPWYWTCYGQNGGSDVSCTAYKSQTNQAPSVYAGSYKTVQSGQSVYMDATASDPQGYSLNYSWNCNNGSLSSYNNLNPTYYAPTVYSDTTYTCTLTATNTVGLSNSSTVNILVRAGSTSQGPTAYAGSNKTVQSGQSTYMDASASDPQGGYLTYSWTCNGGSLSSYNTLNPTYYAPTVNSNTNYTCTLTVTNNRGQSASSSVTISVTAGQNYSNLTVSTYDATSITTSSAILNGALNGYNTGYVNARFAYGRSNNLNLTTSASGSLTYNQRFSASVYNLEKGKAYSFRAEATGNNSNTVYGNTLKFITAPDSPYNFNAYFNGSNGINLSWSTGQGACYTVITRKLGSYPVSGSDGTVVYFGSANSHFDQNIYTNKTYYYRAWSVGCDEGLYSWSDSVYAKKSVSTYTEKKIIYIPPVSVVRNISLNITGKNITQNGIAGETVSAAPGDEVEVNITVSSADTHSLENVILTNVLPANLDNVSNIRLNGKVYTGQVDGTILLGTIPVNQAKTLTFTIKIGNAAAGQSLTDKVNASATNADTVEDILQINVSQAIAAAASVCPATTVTDTGSSWWWNLLWLLIGLIVGLIIFLLVYLIIKKMNEKKEAEQQPLAPVYAKDRYFSIQQ